MVRGDVSKTRMFGTRIAEAGFAKHGMLKHRFLAVLNVAYESGRHLPKDDSVTASRGLGRWQPEERYSAKGLLR